MSLIGFSSIDNAIAQITRLDVEIAYLENSIQTQQKQIKKENEQYKSYEEQLSQSNKQMQDVISSINELNVQMQDVLRELSASRLDTLLVGFKCKTVDELIIKRKTLENSIIDRKKPLDMIRMQIFSLRHDIKNREANITKLLQREALLLLLLPQ